MEHKAWSGGQRAKSKEHRAMSARGVIVTMEAIEAL